MLEFKGGALTRVVLIGHRLVVLAECDVSGGSPLKAGALVNARNLKYE